ncbi:MAG: LamG domain-containing protein [Patescibacteria group bacterium]
MSNNIIWGVNSGSGYLYGINQDSVDDNSDIWNNVIYGFNSSVVISGIGYVYNNTVFNGAYGIMNYGTTIAKNNLVASTTDPYSGSFAVGTDYNATDINDAIGQGSNNRVSQTFLFADSANADYRLASGDTGALGWGVNLSADSSLAFTTDIEGQSRMASSTAFDIGADQFAATHIYRSVGPGKTTAFDIGASNAMTITGSSATFAAALPANVGVGDVIQYATTTGATVNSLAFISGRSSPTSFTVQDVSGHIASSTSANTGWSLFRAYTSLSLAEAGTENTGIASGLRNFDTWSGGKNLASSTEVWNIAAYGDAADTTAVSVSGWTTTASNYIKIYTPYLPSEVGVSQRHKGKWDNTKYRLEAGASTAMVKASVGYIRLEGLQLKIITASDYRSAISHESVAGDMYIDSNIIVGEITGSSVRAILLAIGNNYVNNNIIYGNFSSFGIGDYNNPSNIYAYNNTIYGIAGDAFRPSDSIFVAKNNIAYDNDTDYLGTFDSSSTNNLSKDATAPAYGTYYRNKKVNFVNTASTTAPDLHLLASDVWARDMGADLSGDANLSFNTDIDGGPRPAGRAFDIGADEMAGATQINSPLSGRFKDSSLVGYWSFDGADMNWASTTAEALDLSGNNNHGNVTNFDKKSVTPGINGQGMKFDGVDDYVDTGTPAVLNFGVNSPWTFSTWINPVSAPYPNYFNYRFVGPGGSGGAYLDIANLNHKFIYREGGGSYTEYSFSNESAADIFDKWTHLSFVADGAGNIALYKNGAYIETITGLVRTDFRPYKLGEGYTGKPLKGSLDDVRVYNRALSAGEISEQYKAGAARMKANAPTGASGGLSSASGLVGYWSFNGADMSWASTTAEALDRSGNSNNGNVTNFNNKSVTPGISGQALKFDGSDDYINIPDNGTILDFASTSPYTWSSWIKNASTTSGTSCFISKDICSNKAFGFNLCLNQTGSTADVVVCDFAAPGCNWQCSSGLSLGLSSNTWVHVVITYNGASGWGTYVNGVYKGDQTLFVNSDTTASYYIGSGNSSGLSQSPGRFFSGQIDDVRIFNRALTASEISQLYNSGGRKAEVTP